MTKKATRGSGLTCRTCLCRLSDDVHARCSVCIDFPQCLSCLSVGREADHHLCTHEFFLVGPASPPVSSDWSGEDELRLLLLIRRLGLGNWNDISHHMSPRTPSELESHYVQLYLESRRRPLPEIDVKPPPQLPDPPSFNTSPTVSDPVEGTETDLIRKNKRRRTTFAEYNGFMPHRHEFSEVYHKDAEKLVANLAFDQKKETDDSFLMKIQNLICYNTQINERANRTKVIEEWDFHHIEVANVPEKDLTIWRLNGKTQNEKKLIELLFPLVNTTA